MDGCDLVENGVIASLPTEPYGTIWNPQQTTIATGNQAAERQEPGAKTGRDAFAMERAVLPAYRRYIGNVSCS